MVACLRSGREAASVDEFSFRRPCKRIHGRINPANPGPSRRTTATQPGTVLGEPGAGVLASADAVENHSSPVAAAGSYGGVQTLGDEVGAQMLGHGAVQQPAGTDIEHGGQVQPSLLGGDAGDVAGPPWRRRIGREVQAEQLWGRARQRGGTRSAQPLARVHTDEVMDAPEPLHLLVIDHPAFVAQLGVYPEASRTCRRRTRAPCGSRRPGWPRPSGTDSARSPGLATSRSRPRSTLRRLGRQPLPESPRPSGSRRAVASHPLDSLPQKAVARLSRARPICSFASSCSSSRSRVCSSMLSPFCSARSRRACWTQ